MTAIEVYAGSNGELTKQYYAELSAVGEIGKVAMNLFLAQKCSSRAKVYRGRHYKNDAYARKQWSIDQLCEILEQVQKTLKLPYGWKEDPEVLFGEKSSWVLYVDLPNGQVSFHCPSRGDGPDYESEWDRKHESESRILHFCDALFRLKPLVMEFVRIKCPECSIVQDAVEELFYGDPFWSYVHNCTNCKYVIMESEWNKVSENQEILFGNGDPNGIPGIMKHEES